MKRLYCVVPEGNLTQTAITTFAQEDPLPYGVFDSKKYWVDNGYDVLEIQLVRPTSVNAGAE